MQEDPFSALLTATGEPKKSSKQRLSTLNLAMYYLVRYDVLALNRRYLF